MGEDERNCQGTGTAWGVVIHSTRVAAANIFSTFFFWGKEIRHHGGKCFQVFWVFFRHWALGRIFLSQVNEVKH